MITKEFIEGLNKTITIEGQTLIISFFITFSRFECALKASNFVTGGNDRVSANWDSFVSTIRQSFMNNRTQELKDAVEYLIQHPPRIQIIDNSQLDWRDRVFQDNEPEINRLSQSIRDIRNNLFHGGKFNGNYQQDVSRNYILLKNSIVVLNEWLRLSDVVRNNYLQPIA